MNLENYISQLLYRYQCVTVPGFGAFLTQIQSAQLIENTNTFYPPKKIISFNNLLKNNDGLLANHIAKSEKSTYEYALNYINFEVENWHTKLNEFGQISIKNVGDFYLNSGKKIIFEPLTQINYLSESFGLSNFNSPIVARQDQNIYYNDDSKIVARKITPNITTAPIVDTKQPKRYSNPYLKYAAILIIVAGVEAKYIIELNNETTEEENLLVQKRVQQKLYDKIQTATFVIQNPLSNKEDIKQKTLNYHVIANSFQNKENAIQESEKLKEKGYQSIILPENENGVYQVTYNSYATFEEAKNAESRHQANNENAWTLIQELKK